jgi:membrane-bound lytic murein transglycosylase A
MVSRFKRSSFPALTVLAFALFACAAPMTPSVKPVPSKQGAFGDDLDSDSLRQAIRYSIAYLQKQPAERVVGEEPRRLTAKEILDSLAVFENLLDRWSCAECFMREINARFDLVPSSSDPGLSQVLFTGYYQPVIDGSLVRTERFRYPLYAKPPDLVSAEKVTLVPQMSVERIVGRDQGEQFLPYFTRRQIDEDGSLRGHSLEIAWVADPVELFFLHIQGSGIIRLPDGTELNVGYAAQNGWPYRSIGRLLIDRGKIAPEEMSMQRLRRYLSDHPDEQSEILAYNESYVFFRVNPVGPLGSLGVPVTAGRSIATDSRLFPKGALALIQTEIPILDGGGRLMGWRPVIRFVANQDTGGAIRGLQRADIYFGTGSTAEGLGGYMNRPGKMFFLILKPDQRSDNDAK